MTKKPTSTKTKSIQNLPHALLDLSEGLVARNAGVCDEVLAVIHVAYAALASKNPRATINRSFGQLKRSNHNFYQNIVHWLERQETATFLSGSGHWWSAVEWHRAFSEMSLGVKPSIAWRINGRPTQVGMRDAEDAAIYSTYLRRVKGLSKSYADMLAAQKFGVDEAAVRREQMGKMPNGKKYNRLDGLDTASVTDWVNGTFSKYKMGTP